MAAVRSAVDLHGKAAIGATLIAGMLTRLIAVHLLRNYSRRNPVQLTESALIPTGRMRRVLQYMRAHLDHPISISEWAQLSGCSASWFARLVKQATDDSPHRYLSGLRMSRARDLLENSDLSVIRVGLQCGFPQPTHFSTACRQWTGMSPRVWRATRRGVD